MLTRTFFHRPPLTAGRFAPLPAGAVSARAWARDRLIALRAGLLTTALSPAKAEGGLPHPDALEAALLAAALLGDDGLRGEALALCRRVAESQREDGFFPGESFAARGRMLRAIACGYSLCGERALLTFILRYMKFLSLELKRAPLSPEDAMHIADTLEAGVFAYDVTGQRAILPVLTQLISQGADYAGLFHAFPYRTPVSRAHGEGEILDALKTEGDDGYFHHLMRTADGANLCEGLRAAALSGAVSGSGKQLSAAEAGLARLYKAHGAAGGGVTADPLLAGTHPSRGVPARAVGELAASLCACLSCPGGEYGYDALETLVYNAADAAFSRDYRAAQAVQQANQLALDGAKRFSLLPGGESLFAPRDAGELGALLSAWPRFLQSQWAVTRDDGLCAMGYAPCCVRYRLGGTFVRALVEGDYPAGGAVRITLSLEREAAFPLVLRIPEWARGASVAVGGEIVACEAGGFLTLNREWRDGDALLLTLPMAVRTEPCFHQAVSVARGPLRFAYAPQAERGTDEGGLPLARAKGSFGVALVSGAPIEAQERGARVSLRAKAVAVPWGMRGPSADQPPIVTEAAGDAFDVELVPYAESDIRLAVLPVI